MTRDADLVAGLWEVAPFARLPTDAPAELRDLIEEIDNPKRVYAVHKASRRHDFQLLVQRHAHFLSQFIARATLTTCMICLADTSYSSEMVAVTRTAGRPHALLAERESLGGLLSEGTIPRVREP